MIRGLSPYKEECDELINLEVHNDFYLRDVILEYNGRNVILRGSLIIVSAIRLGQDRKRFKFSKSWLYDFSMRMFQ